MGDSAKAEKTKAKAPKKSWFDGLKSEFHKIIWPDKTELGKETLAVAVVSILLGVLIAVVDFVVFLSEIIRTRVKIWQKQTGM